MSEDTFDSTRALDLITQIEEHVDELKTAVRGADSALVSLKVATLQAVLDVLRIYVEEARDVEYQS